MSSHREEFFRRQRYAVVGNSKRKPFPKLSYEGLRRMGKTVYPVDLGGAPTVSGDKAYASVADLPESVEGAVVEVPRDATMGAVEQVAAAGIKDVWLHMKSETPEVLEFCEREGLDARWGTCAVMYTGAGSYHRLHRGVMKLLRRF